MLNQETVNKLITWTNFVGILSIVFGALSALGGVFAFVIGAIPGVVMIIMGVKLLNAKKAAQELLMIEDQSIAIPKLDQLLSEITTYFKIQGILYIVSIAVGILSVIIYIAFIASFLGSMY